MINLKKIANIALVSLALSMTASCAYRADLAQGNYVEQENVDKLRYGMSDDQVRFILGTPMLIDPFDNTRWYYVNYMRDGWSDPKIKNLIVLFSGRTLIDISGDFKKPVVFNDTGATLNKVDLNKL